MSRYLALRGKVDVISKPSENVQKWYQIAPGLSLCKWKAYSNDTEETPVFPAPSDTFKAFELVEPNEVKVVVLGQDPYHTPGKASGLAFGYHRSYSGPVDSSLYNIRAEIERNYPGTTQEFDLSLESLARQGVLLLNTRLSVEQHKPMSHAVKIGWETEIERILKFIAHCYDKNVVWLLWGAEARNMVADIVDLRGPNVFYTSHPCKFSHKATDKPFTGSGCFGGVNAYLESIGKQPIKWS